MLGIVTVNFYSDHHTSKFIDSIIKFRKIKLVVIDNSDTLNLFPPKEIVEIIKPKQNLGLSRAWRLGFQHLKNKTETIIFSNNDAVLSAEFINYCKEIDVNRNFIYGPKIVDINGEVWSAGGKFNKPFYNVKHNTRDIDENNIETFVEHISGCIWVLPKKVFSKFHEIIPENFFFRGEEWYFNLISERIGIKKILVNHICIHDENGSHNRFSSKYLYFLFRAKWVFYNLAFNKNKALLLNYTYIFYQLFIGILKFTRNSESNYFQIVLQLKNAYKQRKNLVIKEDEFSNSLP